ncbi:Gfo/Idh/MocA family protein [Microbacterium sp. ASV49]|uniref:Gfo/Idh/MocA family oxidoreductase n=1 Tax=Microbacterium candidum TaxID=3041922 RepID=A0ABT7MU07_9MICO|nr:Gfo/Idh/MocA family oxidoreductase [Microbacterium sp. ASV49]MDL9977936.1 Gfo/Idh/MocA family oxidoreductase [Microbacterium sp. ASV49]
MSGIGERITIGLIGAGTISQSVHVTSLRRAGFDLRIVCDLSPSRAAEVAASCGAIAMTDPADVFASDVDAVLIATPGSHAELAAQAIRAGKHVLAEKPLAFTVREVEELEALAAEAGVITQVGYMKMFDPLLPKAASEVGELHGIRLVRVTVMHPADEPQIAHLRLDPPAPDADPARIAAAVAYDRDRAREALPGASDALLSYYSNVLNGSVIHELSLMRALDLPLPQEWTAQTVTPLDGTEPPSLLATATVDDAAYVLSWNWLPDYPEYDEELTVLAANGRLEFHLAKPYLVEERSRLTSRRHDGELRADTDYTAGHETGFLRQLDAFATAIRTGELNRAAFAGAKQDIAQLQRLAQAVAASLGQQVGTEA